MNDPAELRRTLASYIGSESLYRHPFNRTCAYTEGVAAFAQEAGGGAFWFLDILMTEPEILKGQREKGIVFISLNVVGSKATITVRGDSDQPSIFTREIDWTDCPEGEWKFYFGDNVLMLPSEY